MRKIKDALRAYLRLDILSLSFVICPLFTFLHELVHALFLSLGGIPAHLQIFSIAAPVGYAYDIQGLSEAAAHYGSTNGAVFLAALAAPLFTLIVSYASYALYRGKGWTACWVMAINPLIFKLLGALPKLPKYIDGSIRKSDEAIIAFFGGIPLPFVIWPSLFLGILCIALLVAATRRGERVKDFASAVIGGGAGFFIVEEVVDSFLK